MTLQSFLIFNPNLWRASNSLGSGRIAQNRVVNSFSNAGQHIAKAGKLSILNERSKKQKLGQKMSYSLDIQIIAPWCILAECCQNWLESRKSFLKSLHILLSQRHSTQKKKWYMHQRKFCSSFHSLKSEMRSFIAFYYFGLSRNK